MVQAVTARVSARLAKLMRMADQDVVGLSIGRSILSDRGSASAASPRMGSCQAQILGGQAGGAIAGIAGLRQILLTTGPVLPFVACATE